MLIEATAFEPRSGNAPIASPDASPYPGLRPFSERDRRVFFGREAETGALLNLLECQQLVVVHGASGCGKSSLVRAGLLPVFRMDAAANSKRAFVVIVRPADEGGPLLSLARKLDQEIDVSSDIKCDPNGEPLSWSTILTTSPDWSKDIGERVSAAGGTLCILFDQFEEIFAASKAGHAAQVHRIIEFLNSLMERSPEGTALGGRPISVVVTMRSDYLGNCAIWEGFAETVNRCQYLLPRISTLGLLRAIHEPARLSSGYVDERIAEQLLCVVKSEMDGLPIVQHALSRAWRWSTSARGTHDIDEGAMNAVGGADRTLSNHAEEVFAEATGGNAELQDIANWVLRSLGDLDTDGRIIRRSIPLDQLEQEVGVERDIITALLQPFRDPANSLIMPPSTEELQDKTVISVSHEALLRQWKRISDPSFEGGRAVGLAFREMQDSIIWRAIAVQAQQFADDGKSVLGPAATEQRLPWFRELSKRHGWISRHEMQSWPAAKTEIDRRWQQVNEFMEASDRNLQREKHLVSRLWWLQAAVIALAAMLTTGLYWYWSDEAARKEQENRERIEKVEAEWSEAYALRNAFFMAQRYCAGRAPDGRADDACIRQQVERFRSDGSFGDNKLPRSQLGGGFSKPVGGQGGAR